MTRSRKRTGRLLLAVLLFAQAAIAWAACDMPERSAAQAIAREPAAPCHEEPGPNPNLCLAHCLSADQTPDSPAPPVVMALPAPVLIVPAPLAAASAPAASRFVLPRPAAPPPRILFQSFLI